MPATIRRFSAAGLSEVGYRAESLAEAARHEPEAGVYTVGNTFHTTRALLLDAHLDRLEDSARREGFALQLDRPALRAALREMILDSGYGDSRFRISVPTADPASMLLSIEPHHPPPESLIKAGVSCCTARLTRRNPSAKSSDWMRIREELWTTAPPDCYEIILVDEAGRLLEGATSNVYAIIDGVLRTAGDGALPGISRRITLEVCQDLLPLELRAPTLDELPGFSEAFLSSSSRGLIPITRIDGLAIGVGRPGRMTLKLRAGYDGWVATRLEEL